MSSPRLIPARYQTTKIRLSDAAGVGGTLSLLFGVLVLLFPDTFPRIIAENWESGRLTALMAFGALIVNGAIYLRVVHLRHSRAQLWTSAYIAFLTVVVIVGFSFLEHAAVLRTELQLLPQPALREREEILAHTYFALIAAIFIPFLLVRLTQNFKRKS